MSICPFRKGEIVNIITLDHVYTCYSQVFSRIDMWKYCLKWSYRSFPTIDRPYKILKILKHKFPDKYDINEYCIVIQDTVNSAIYLTGEHGLQKVSAICV